MTKQRQAEVLKKQQGKEKAKAQAEANRDKTDNTNKPRAHKPKGKASHPDQIKSSKKSKRTPRTLDDNRLPNDPKSDQDTQDEDILIGDENIVPDDGEEPLSPERIGFTPSFLKEKVTCPILWV